MTRAFNPFDRFLRREAKASRTGPLLVQLGTRQARFTPRQYDRLAEEGFQKNVIAYRCIKLISQNLASVPWRLFETGGETKTRLTDHPLLSLLARPNPLQARAEFFEALAGFYLISGNSYIEAVSPGGGPPLELWALRPDRMRIVPGNHGLPASYRYQAGGRTVEFPASPLTGQAEILHLKAFHPLDDWYGMSPLEAAAISIDQHNDAAKWNAALLQMSGRPSGALVFNPAHPDSPDSLTEAQRQTLKAELEQYFSGSANAGRPLVLEGGLDWREMSLSPKEMDWLAGKDGSAREIALAFHIPPQLIGIDGSLTFANFEQARLALFDDAVLPLLGHIRDEFNGWLAPKFGENLVLDFDLDAIEALAPRRDRYWEKISSAGFMTVNEKREKFGLPPLKGGDNLG